MLDLDWYAIIFVVVVGFLIGYVVSSPGMFQVEIGLLEGSATPELLSDDETSKCTGCPLIETCSDAPSPLTTPRRVPRSPCPSRTSDCGGLDSQLSR